MSSKILHHLKIILLCTVVYGLIVTTVVYFWGMSKYNCSHVVTYDEFYTDEEEALNDARIKKRDAYVSIHKFDYEGLNSIQRARVAFEKEHPRPVKAFVTGQMGEGVCLEEREEKKRKEFMKNILSWPALYAWIFLTIVYLIVVRFQKN